MSTSAPRALPFRRGVAYNLAGAAVPALVALAALPALAAGLGTERLGVLALVWTTLGYFGLLHLGIGRALTHSAAGGAGREGELAPRVWTGLALVAAAGTVAAAVLAACAPLLAGRVLRVPAALEAETAGALRLLALALPFVVSSPVLTGLLEARYRFGWVSAVSAPVSVVSYLGPLALLPITRSLVAVVALLAAVRVAAWLVLLALCAREVPALRARPAVRRRHAGPLLRFGGWTTVSAVVSPLMVYMDRFALGASLSAAAVAFYAVPQEVVLRLGAVSGAVVGVLFPAFAAAHSAGGGELRVLARRGMAAVSLLVFPLAVVLAAFGRDALQLWMGAEFAARGGAVLAWLAPGLMLNGYAKVPAALLQGLGRPDAVARRHLVELALYLPALALLVSARGVEGAAIAWLGRVGLDAALLFRAVRHPAGLTRGVVARAGGMAAVVGAVSVAGLALPPGAAKAGIAAAALGLGWLLARGREEAA